MPEHTSNHPISEIVGEIRQGINSQIPRAERILKRTESNPPRRQIINVAGDLYRQRRELEAQGEIDSKTGLLNEKGFHSVIQREIARAKRSGEKIVLMFLDLNDLKKVNDELGHEIGDERLKAAADILSASFRPTDIIARMGEKADEFLVALPVADLDLIKDRYAEINKNINAANQNWEGYPIHLPAGAVELDFNDIEGSVTRADHAMYVAKEKSKEIGQNVINVERELVTI